MKRALTIVLFVTALALPANLVVVQAGVAACLALLVAGRIRGTWRFVPTPLDGPIAWFTAACLVSMVVTPEPVRSAFHASAFWVALAYYPLAQAFIAAGLAGRTRAFLAAILGVSALAAAYAVYQHFTGADWFGAGSAVEPSLFAAARFRAVAWFTRHTTLGFVLAFAVIVGAVLAMETRAWGARTALAVLTLLPSVALFYTYVRMAWIGAAAGLVVAGALKGRRWAVGFAAALAAAGAVAAVASPGVLLKATYTFSEPQGMAQRDFIWRNSIEIAGDYAATGVGFGNFSFVAKRYYDRYDPSFLHRAKAHNLYLHLLVETGPLGLLAFLFIWVRLFGVVWRAAGAAPPGPGREAILAAGGVAACLLTGSLAQDPYFDGQVAFTLFFVLASGMASLAARGVSGRSNG